MQKNSIFLLFLNLVLYSIYIQISNKHRIHFLKVNVVFYIAVCNVNFFFPLFRFHFIILYICTYVQHIKLLVCNKVVCHFELRHIQRFRLGALLQRTKTIENMLTILCLCITNMYIQIQIQIYMNPGDPFPLWSHNKNIRKTPNSVQSKPI